MLLEAPFLLAVAVFFDHPLRAKLLQKILLHANSGTPNPEDEADSDVAAERHRVETADPVSTSDTVRMFRLNKAFPSRGAEIVAVKNLSLGVQRGEVLGLLGTNGAGKTTVMSILTGDLLPTSGNATIFGWDVVKDRKAALRHVGYCPQFDAVLDLLTPLEHLGLFAALRGVPKDEEERVVGEILELCDLGLFGDVPASQLSGGNRRKLSLALALVGNPEVLVLDEPSAGMDPLARRKMWAVIQRVSKRASVLLATHLLEEAEVLADRVTIMVAGKLACIGPLHHLKDKFHCGYEIRVKVCDVDDLPPLRDFVATAFPDCVIAEEHFQLVTFSIPCEKANLRSLFATFEGNKERLHITDFSLSRASLAQMFLEVSDASATLQQQDPAVGTAASAA